MTRNGHDYSGTSHYVRHEGNFTEVGVHDASYDGEAQTCPRSGSTRVGLPEPIEGAARVFAGHSGSRIGHLEQRLVSLFENADLDASAMWGMPNGIADKVDGNLAQAGLVALDDY